MPPQQQKCTSALIAARRWRRVHCRSSRLSELTAASRFAGWEQPNGSSSSKPGSPGVEECRLRPHDHEGRRGGTGRGWRVTRSPRAAAERGVDLSFQAHPEGQALMERLGLTDDDFTARYAGRCVNYEGLDDLLAAISIPRRTACRHVVIIVGDGAVRSQLEALSAGTGPAKAVTFIGRVMPDEIEGYLFAGGCVVPIARKPFKVCMVGQSAQAVRGDGHGKGGHPFGSSGPPGDRADGETGLICKPADRADLAATLARLAHDPGLGSGWERPRERSGSSKTGPGRNGPQIDTALSGH